MKMDTKKIAATFAILMMALGIAGFAYAHWSETLYITGTVETGILDAEMSAGMSWDSEIEGKDYSSISCYVDPMNPKLLIVTITNAYPCIDYYQEFNITNTGTIPLHINSFTVTEALPEGSIIDITNLISTQIHPDDSAWGTIHIHLSQAAEEGTTYTFGVTIEVVQWNYPW